MTYGSNKTVVETGLPLRLFASYAEKLFKLWEPGAFSPPFERMAAYYELVALAGFTHIRPDCGIDLIATRDRMHEVEETPFCNLLKLAQRDIGGEPKVLLIAPMSGHFATLLRNIVRTLLQDHKVYVTDWKNIRDTPLAAGVFDLDAFIQHIIDFIRTIGPQSHVAAVCQSTLAAQDLCTGLKPYMKSRHMQPGVGHYGVFSGRRWETQVYPVLRNHVRASL